MSWFLPRPPPPSLEGSEGALDDFSLDALARSLSRFCLSTTALLLRLLLLLPSFPFPRCENVRPFGCMSMLRKRRVVSRCVMDGCRRRRRPSSPPSLPPSTLSSPPARPPSLMRRRSTWSVGHYSARAHEQKARLIAVVKASGSRTEKGTGGCGRRVSHNLTFRGSEAEIYSQELTQVSFLEQQSFYLWYFQFQTDLQRN